MWGPHPLVSPQKVLSNRGHFPGLLPLPFSRAATETGPMLHRLPHPQPHLSPSYFKENIDHTDVKSLSVPKPENVPTHTVPATLSSPHLSLCLFVTATKSPDSLSFGGAISALNWHPEICVLGSILAWPLASQWGGTLPLRT